jgi:hypothetical protein
MVPLDRRQFGLDVRYLAQLLGHLAIRSNLGRIDLSIVLATGNCLEDTDHRSFQEGEPDFDHEDHGEQDHLEAETNGFGGGIGGFRPQV